MKLSFGMSFHPVCYRNSLFGESSSARGTSASLVEWLGVITKGNVIANKGLTRRPRWSDRSARSRATWEHYIPSLSSSPLDTCMDLESRILGLPVSAYRQTGSYACYDDGWCRLHGRDQEEWLRIRPTVSLSLPRNHARLVITRDVTFATIARFH